MARKTPTAARDADDENENPNLRMEHPLTDITTEENDLVNEIMTKSTMKLSSTYVPDYRISPAQITWLRNGGAPEPTIWAIKTREDFEEVLLRYCTGVTKTQRAYLEEHGIWDSRIEKKGRKLANEIILRHKRLIPPSQAQMDTLNRVRARDNITDPLPADLSAATATELIHKYNDERPVTAKQRSELRRLGVPAREIPDRFFEAVQQIRDLGGYSSPLASPMPSPMKSPGNFSPRFSPYSRPGMSPGLDLHMRKDTIANLIQ
jgi:hypothetical protein